MRALVRRTVAGTTLLLLAAGIVRAQEEAPPGPTSPEEAAAQREEYAKQSLAFYAGMAKLAGDERLADAEARSVLAHAASFRSMSNRDGEDAPQARVEARFDETGEYDFALYLSMPEFREWASSHGLDGRAWLRWRMRAELLVQREDQADGLDEYRKNVEELEELATLIDDESVRGVAEEGRWILTLLEKTIALIPAPTEEEKRVLDRHGAALRKALDLAEADVPGEGAGGGEGGAEPGGDAAR